MPPIPPKCIIMRNYLVYCTFLYTLFQAILFMEAVPKHVIAKHVIILHDCCILSSIQKKIRYA